MTGVEIAVIGGVAITAADAIAVVGAAAATAGALSAAKAESDKAKFNAKVAENEAIAVRQAAETEASDVKRKARRLQAKQLVQTAKTGLSLGGSTLDIIADDAKNAELDRQRILRSGSISEARALSQAALDRSQARAARKTGRINAASTFLGSISKAPFLN